MAAQNYILANGLIIDGTEKAEAFIGNVLIEDGIIGKISREAIDSEGTVIDCKGKVISPGFIDMHSHMDWYLTVPGREEYKNPFTQQGITTFIAGNCGFGTSAFRNKTAHRDKLENNLFKAGHEGIPWNGFDEYMDVAEKSGLSHNLANLVGHGTTRASIKGYDSSPLTGEEMAEMLSLLEEAMDKGALGVSFGLQYEPGIFAPYDELKEIALLVKRKNKFISVHPRACSAVSAAYPLVPFGREHHIKAIEEILRLAGETGVRLQFSHLIFVGRKTWKSYRKVLSLFENAAAQGLDVRFDTYGHHCGASVITAFLPDWFMAGLPLGCSNRKLLRKLKLLMGLSFRLLDFGYGDIQVTYANNEELNRFNGRFLNDIARERGLSQFDNYIDFVAKSGGQARVLMYNYTNGKILKELIRHPLSLYMTDAWIEPAGKQNPGVFGSFPRIMQIALEEKLIPIEQLVHKMTGAAALRTGIAARGFLKEGFMADITVFDPDNIRDNTCPEDTSASPDGIEYVFINGHPVLFQGEIRGDQTAGKPLLVR